MWDVLLYERGLLNLYGPCCDITCLTEMICQSLSPRQLILPLTNAKAEIRVWHCFKLWHEIPDYILCFWQIWQANLFTSAVCFRVTKKTIADVQNLHLLCFMLANSKRSEMYNSIKKRKQCNYFYEKNLEFKQKSVKNLHADNEWNMNLVGI